MDKITFTPIGTIHSPFTEIKGMPIQPTGAQGITGTIELNPAYIEGLKDLKGFSHIILVYHLHRSEGYSLMVKPFLDDKLRGIFATRSPHRPSPIGLSIVKLIKVDSSIIHVEGLDILDGTPLLDIKPYVPDFDSPPAEKLGWFTGKSERAEKARADERFSKKSSPRQGKK